MFFPENINDTGFDEFNSVFSFLISLIFSLALIFATSRVKIYSDHVKRMQIFTAFTRLSFSFLIVLSSPTLAYVIEAEAVYIVKRGFKLPILFGRIILITFITFIVFSCLTAPMQFLQVVFIVKNHPRSQKPIIQLTTVISLIISLSATVLTTIGYTPTSEDDELSHEIVYHLNGKGDSAYLIASLERFDFELNEFVADPTSWAATLYILWVLVITTVISVICYVIILIEIHRGQKTRSMATIAAEKQLNMGLMVQFALPFLTIHVPFYVSFLIPLFRIGTSSLSIYLPYLFSWCPAINPILVILMVKSVREKAFSKFRGKSSNSSGNNTNFFVRIRK